MSETTEDVSLDVGYGIRLDRSVVALRPCRIVRETLRLYTATTFPVNPNAGCELHLRRMAAFGYLDGKPGDALKDEWIDALDADGGIVQEWPITARGFEWLRGKLRFVRDDPATR
jgi:hypothetical protein